MTVLGNWWDLNPRDTQFKMGAKLQRGISSVDQMANQQSSGRRFFHTDKRGAAAAPAWGLASNSGPHHH